MLFRLRTVPAVQFLVIVGPECKCNIILIELVMRPTKYYIFAINLHCAVSGALALYPCSWYRVVALPEACCIPNGLRCMSPREAELGWSIWREHAACRGWPIVAACNRTLLAAKVVANDGAGAPMCRVVVAIQSE